LPALVHRRQNGRGTLVRLFNNLEITDEKHLARPRPAAAFLAPAAYSSPLTASQHTQVSAAKKTSAHATPHKAKATKHAKAKSARSTWSRRPERLRPEGRSRKKPRQCLGFLLGKMA
jgi:hypothetical protein